MRHCFGVVGLRAVESPMRWRCVHQSRAQCVIGSHRNSEVTTSKSSNSKSKVRCKCITADSWAWAKYRLQSVGGIRVVMNRIASPTLIDRGWSTTKIAGQKAGASRTGADYGADLSGSAGLLATRIFSQQVRLKSSNNTFWSVYQVEYELVQTNVAGPSTPAAEQ